MKYKTLWSLCEECLESYDDSDCTTTEEHIAAYLQRLGAKTPLDEEEQQFVRETVVGCLRYISLLHLAVEGYAEAMKRNKQDITSLLIMAYLTVFRYRELGPLTFRLLVQRATITTRISEFLNFLHDEKFQTDFIVPRWRTLFDDAFVDSMLIGALKKNVQEFGMDEVLAYFHEKACGTDPASHEASAASGTEKKPLTKPVEFAFASTKKKPQSKAHVNADERELTFQPKVTKTRPPDVATEEQRAAVDAFRKGEKRGTVRKDVLEANRASERQRLFDKNADRLMRKDTRQLEKMLEEKRKKDEAAMRPEMAHPVLTPEEVRAKLGDVVNTVTYGQTAAALRREDIIYRRREQEEEEQLRHKAHALRDASEFEAWRNEMNAKDEQEKKTAIHQRKIDMMLADEAARAAREEQTETNQEAANEMKKELDRMRRKFRKENDRKLRENQEIAKKIRQDLDERTQKALQHVRHTNLKEGDEVRNVKHQNEVTVAMQLELEKQRKSNLIDEIKYIHAQHIAAFKELSPKERRERRVPGVADLNQAELMTVEELYAKIDQMRAEQQSWRESKNKDINRSRLKEKAEADRMSQNIEAKRNEFRENKARERAERREREAELAEKQRLADEEKLRELQSKLEVKRDHRKNQQKARREEERARRVAAQLLSADANAIEKKKWAEMERGEQNVLVQAQNRRKADQRQKVLLEKSEHNQRETLIKQRHAKERDTRREIDAMYDMKKTQFLAEQAEETQLLSETYWSMREMKRSATQHKSIGATGTFPPIPRTR